MGAKCRLTWNEKSVTFPFMSEIQEPPSLPVFIVTGSNFTVEVKLDEFNAGFDLMHQQYEAATRALETLKNVREDDSCRIVMNPDSRNENPKAGVTILVHAKGTDPENALPIPTYLCFANIGLYPEAEQHKKDFDKMFAEQKKLLADNEQAKAKEAVTLNLMARANRPSTPKKKTPKKKS